jgi:hypothetical protein
MIRSKVHLVVGHDENGPHVPDAYLDDDGCEARVVLHEDGDECCELVGCPWCLVNLLRCAADRIERMLGSASHDGVRPSEQAIGAEFAEVIAPFQR